MNVPLASSVPAVIDGLVTAFSAISSDNNYGAMQVLDGPDIKARNVRNLIVVGNVEGASGDWSSSGRGGALDESYDIACLTWAWSGITTMKQHRDRCYTVLAAIRAIVLTQPVSGAYLSMGQPFQLTQSAAGEGKAAALEFAIHVTAAI